MVEGISDEILSKTAKHSRNKSDTFPQPSSDGDGSPATAVHKWFSNILKPNTNNSIIAPPSPESLPPRQPLPRKSRFQTTEPSPAPHPQGIPAPNSRRTFKTSAPSPENPNRLNPPPSDTLPLSPPRNIVESAHRRTISSSTCSREKIAPTHVVAKGEEANEDQHCLNGFLKEQRVLFQKFRNGELHHANAKIVLSGRSNS